MKYKYRESYTICYCKIVFPMFLFGRYMFICSNKKNYIDDFSRITNICKEKTSLEKYINLNIV